MEVLVKRDGLLEAPTVDDDGRVYFSDVLGGGVHRWSPDGSVETVIADDGAGERRRASYDDIEEQARTLSGRVEVEAGQDGGTAVRVTLPPYAAHR